VIQQNNPGLMACGNTRFSGASRLSKNLASFVALL
jgi:hypothetical protein